MNIIAVVGSYAALVGVLVMGLGAGATWVLTPDSSITAHANPAPIPQKLLDSNERKRPVPSQTVATPESPLPAMRESPVSLAPLLPPRRYTVRELPAPSKPKLKRQLAPTQSEKPAPTSSPAVTTARTDFPY